MGRSAKPGVERRQEILKVLRSGQRADTVDLAKRLGVSEMTIRRDLAELETKNLVLRSYGGATLARRIHLEFQFDKRHQGALSSKQAIGEYAANLIEPNETVFINSGTTTLEVARHLAKRQIPVTVATQSLAIGSELWGQAQITILMLGGELSEGSPDLTGLLCEHSLEMLRADRAFLGCDGLQPGRGLFAEKPEAARISTTMAAQSNWCCVVTDSRKIGQQAMVRYAALNEIDLLVTDDGTDARLLAELRDEVKRVQIVDGSRKPQG